MKKHVMRCFGRHETTGNDAIVVEETSSDELDRQDYARRQNAPATVFVDRREGGAVVLDYYYPHARSPLCLHATLAASAVLFEQLPGCARLQLTTSLRGQALTVERDGECLFVELQAQACPPTSVDRESAAGLLGITSAALSGAPRLASVGSAKLLAEVRDESILRGLSPDLARISAWSKEHGISGIYAYCTLGDDVYAGRNFNHLERRLEDAATGVAAGALAALLQRNLTVLQGDLLGQPCTLVARYRDGGVQVGGRASRQAA